MISYDYKIINLIKFPIFSDKNSFKFHALYIIDTEASRMVH